MKNSLIISVITLIAIQFIFANTNTNSITQNQTLFNPPPQGGKLEFGSTSVERFERSTDNSDQLYLNDYFGRPLKALQFKIVIANTNTKLVLKSLSRGSSIPESSFLFDYEIHKGRSDSDGNPIEVINVVILGNAYNVLEPGTNYNLVSINYDIVDLDNDSVFTTISLQDVMGATSSPVEDANIAAGMDEIIYLRKNTAKEEAKINLNQNYPNPFNPITTIKYSIPAIDENVLQNVVLKVYDVLGSEISTLVDEKKASGNYEIEFDASFLSSGIYFYSINSDQTFVTKKMMLMK